MAYAATFDVPKPPQQFERGQTLTRVLLILVIYFVLSGVVGIIWWVLPIFGAIMISQKGPERYLEEAEKGPVTWIRLVLGFWTYAALLSDKLPLESPSEVAFKVQTNGSPSVGKALLRIILVIPHAIVLAVLGWIAGLLWIVTVVSVLMNGVYPEWTYNYFRGYFGWLARVLAYLGSLVDEYPPFSFDDGSAPMAATPPPPAPPAQ
jgi:hypothetical protein